MWIELVLHGDAHAEVPAAEGVVQDGAAPVLGCSTRAAHPLFFFSCSAPSNEAGLLRSIKGNGLGSGGHARVPRAALTLQMTINQL